MINKFKEWLICKKGITETSARKYVSAVSVVSADMIEAGVIIDDLYQSVSTVELQNKVDKIKCNPSFVKKNHRGNNMYSVALNHYLEFVFDKQTAEEGALPSPKSVDILRGDFKDYLNEMHPEWTDKTINAYVSDAFYVYNNRLVNDFWRLLSDDIGLDECFLATYNYLLGKNSKERALSRAKHYHNVASLLSEYILARFGSVDAFLRHYGLGNNRMLTSECRYSGGEGKNKTQAYIEKTDMKYSYKPILLLAIINCIESRKDTTLENIVKFFERFYKNRDQAGLCVERPESIFAKKMHSFNKAANTIMAGPITAFVKAGLIEYSLPEHRINVASNVEKDIQLNGAEIIEACYRRLDNYYKDLEKLFLSERKVDCAWLIGRKVQHVQYGQGIVKKQSRGSIEIEFSGGTHRIIPMIMAPHDLTLVPLKREKADT